MNDWLQSYEKTRAEQNKSIYFLRRVEVTYSKLRKNESRTKETRFFFLSNGSNSASRRKRKVTKIACKIEAIMEDYRNSA